VAHVGYNARAIARLVEWAGTGVETPMYPSVAVRDHEIEFGATLSPIALRNLFDHSAVHLSVEWRDLPERDWANEVKTIQGRTVPATETVWMRTREVWIHAVDLANGATFADIPERVLERLLRDITGAWQARGSDAGLVITVTGTDLVFGDTGAQEHGPQDPVTVSGPLAGVAAWAAGRTAAAGGSGVTASRGRELLSDVPAAPKWI
jgi:maleylpyruvate isomerase